MYKLDYAPQNLFRDTEAQVTVLSPRQREYLWPCGCWAIKVGRGAFPHWRCWGFCDNHGGETDADTQPGVVHQAPPL